MVFWRSAEVGLPRGSQFPQVHHRSVFPILNSFASRGKFGGLSLWCGLPQVSVNDKFASLSEALYIAERQAREEIRLRNEVKKQKKIREEELREQQLRQLAAQARAERSENLSSNGLVISF